MTRQTLGAIGWSTARTLAAVGVLCVGAAAQAPSYDDTGVTVPTVGTVPAGSYSLSQLETINNTTGNVSLRIPITKLPPGRAGSTASLNLLYNSQIYDVAESWAPVTNGGSGDDSAGNVEWRTLVPNSGVGGWLYEWDANYSFAVEILPLDTTAYSGASACTTDHSPPNGNIFKAVLYSPDGSRHPLRLNGYGDNNGDGYYAVAPNLPQPGDVCPGNPSPPTSFSYYTTDGTFIAVKVSTASMPMSWNISFPDGRTATGFGPNIYTMSDISGNTTYFISVANDNTTSTLAEDALGRTITLVHTLTSNSQQTSDTVTQSGFGGQQLQWTVTWNPVSATGAQIVATREGNTIQEGGGITSVSQITLPTTEDGSSLSYGFAYEDTWGEMGEMILPTGASVSYTYAGYGNQSIYGDIFDLLYLNPVTAKIVDWQDQDAPGTPSRQEATGYNFTSANSIIHNPDGGKVTNSFYDLSGAGTNQTAGLVYQTQQLDGSEVQRTWQLNCPPLGGSGNPPCNPYIQTETTFLGANGTSVAVASTSYTYDQNGNQIAISESDLACSSCASPERTTTNTYLLYTNPATAGTPVDNGNAYWDWPWSRFSDPISLNLLIRSVTAGVGTGSIAEFAYGDGVGHYNLTQESHWDSSLSGATQPLSSGNAEITNYTYDAFGNRTSTENPNGYTTDITYDSNYLCPIARVVSAGTAQRIYTYPACDFSTSLPNGITDSDHAITRTFSYDQFGRNTLVSESGSGITRNKTTTYADSNSSRYVFERTDLNSTNDGSIADITYYDQLERVRQTTDLVLDTVQTLYYTPQTYNLVTGESSAAPCSGSLAYSFQLASNPYITGSETSAGWTRTGFDQNGRVIEIEHFSGSPLPCPWGSNGSSTGTATTSYYSNTTTSVDEAGVSRTSAADGLGRLTRVTENGISANTYYSYDALDDLTAVTPASGSGRSFSYNSLKRLIGATNPETGTIAYAYDRNGNLLTKAAGGVTTSFSYDPLDELIGKTYSDSTPAASYTYSKSWRTLASSGSTATAYTFDGLGRATGTTQTTSGTPYTFAYSYNLIDGITSMTMPSGTVVTTGYDGLGRPNALSGRVGSTTTSYVTSVSYAPHSAPQQIFLGNGLTEQTCFNNMLQPFVIRQRRSAATSCQTGTASDSYDVGYFAFTFPATTNNGNIAGQTIQYAASGSYGPMTFQQSYGYDGVNRLSNVTETGSGPTWSQSFGYDAVGNRWLSGGAQIDPTTPTSDVFNSNNQINATTYDAKGNQTTNGGYAFTYDAENRLTSTNMFETTYGYDADGRRVTKTSSGLITTYIYDVTGQLAAQYGGPASCPLTCYLMTDHLGSTRMQTDSGGNQLILYDYAPFGEELAGLDGRDARWGGFSSGIHFTGKEQEGFEGAYMHYFGARYFSAGSGRFTSPDPTILNALKVFNPQRWNLYPYAVNSPLRYVDPDGQEAIAIVYPQFTVQSRNSLPGVPLGHAGVVIVMPDGTTHYFEYGRYDGPDGLVRNAGPNAVPTPSVERDASGQITSGSLTNLLKTLSAVSGKSGKVDALVIPSTAAQDQLMYAYLLNREKQNTDPNRQKYSIGGGHNCGTLICDTLHGAGLPTVPQQFLGGATPNEVFNMLMLQYLSNLSSQAVSYDPKTSVTSTIIY